MVVPAPFWRWPRGFCVTTSTRRRSTATTSQIAPTHRLWLRRMDTRSVRPRRCNSSMPLSHPRGLGLRCSSLRLRAAWLAPRGAAGASSLSSGLLFAGHAARQAGVPASVQPRARRGKATIASRPLFFAARPNIGAPGQCKKVWQSGPAFFSAAGRAQHTRQRPATAASLVALLEIANQLPAGPRRGAPAVAASARAQRHQSATDWSYGRCSCCLRASIASCSRSGELCRWRNE